MEFKSKGLDQEISAIASLTSAVSSVDLDIQNSANTVASTFICGMFSDTGSSLRPTIQFLAGSSIISHSYLAYPDGATSYNQNSGTTSAINFTYNTAYTSSGTYNVKFKFIKPIDANGTMYLETNGMINKMKNAKTNVDIIEMKNIDFPYLEGDLIPFYAIDGKKIFPFWVEIEKIN